MLFRQTARAFAGLFVRAFAPVLLEVPSPVPGGKAAIIDMRVRYHAPHKLRPTPKRARRRLNLESAQRRMLAGAKGLRP